MTIGVLTLPFNNNYGGLLQSYALQNFLKAMGHEVILIQRQSNPLKRSFLGKIKKGVKIIIGQEKKEVEDLKMISENMQNFFGKYMTSTASIYSDKEFEVIKKYNFDAIVVGSDQVWRFDYIRDRYQNYFLNFTDGWSVKRIAYAASFGIDSWNIDENKTQIVKNLLSKFDAISVRESSGVNLCKDILHAKAQLMLDPAFLLTPKDYAKLIVTGKENNKGKLLIYFLDKNPDKVAIAKEMEKELGIESFIVGVKDSSKTGPKEDRIYPPVSKWLQGFADAEYVLTDSYHGCVFAIIFNKPFIVVGNAQRGMARFESLLDLFNLKSRLVDKNLPKSVLNDTINFELVNEVIAERRNLAGSFLKKALDK